MEYMSKWYCNFCGKGFYTEMHLDLHFDNRHPEYTRKVKWGLLWTCVTYTCRNIYFLGISQVLFSCTISCISLYCNHFCKYMYAGSLNIIYGFRIMSVTKLGDFTLSHLHINGSNLCSYAHFWTKDTYIYIYPVLRLERAFIFHLIIQYDKTLTLKLKLWPRLWSFTCLS